MGNAIEPLIVRKPIATTDSNRFCTRNLWLLQHGDFPDSLPGKLPTPRIETIISPIKNPRPALAGRGFCVTS
jgi:hypothetical protein